MRKLLTLLPVIFLAGFLVGCYTLPKSPGVNYDSEEIPIVVISEPFPIPPPPPLPPPPPPPPSPPSQPPPPPPPPPPTRPIDPKQPVKRAADGELKEKEPAGKKSLEIASFSSASISAANPSNLFSIGTSMTVANAV
jgi:hypothetical protein